MTNFLVRSEYNLLNKFIEFNSLTKSGRDVLLGIITTFGYTTPSMTDDMMADSLNMNRVTYRRGLYELRNRGFIENLGYKSYRVLFRLE